MPVSVFVSRKASRLYVRRGYAPLFDTPVTIRDPDEKMGTHVFTVMASKTDSDATRWNVVSMPEKSSVVPDAHKRHPHGKHVAETRRRHPITPTRRSTASTFRRTPSSAFPTC